MFSVRFSVFWPAVNSAAPKTAIPVPTSVQGRGTANGRVIGLQPPAPFLPPKSPLLLSTVWEMAGAAQPAAEELGGIPATAVGPRRRGRSRAAPCGAHSRTGGTGHALQHGRFPRSAAGTAPLPPACARRAAQPVQTVPSQRCPSHTARPAAGGCRGGCSQPRAAAPPAPPHRRSSITTAAANAPVASCCAWGMRWSRAEHRVCWRGGTGQNWWPWEAVDGRRKRWLGPGLPGSRQALLCNCCGEAALGGGCTEVTSRGSFRPLCCCDRRMCDGRQPAGGCLVAFQGESTAALRCHHI